MKTIALMTSGDSMIAGNNSVSVLLLSVAGHAIRHRPFFTIKIILSIGKLDDEKVG